MARILSRASTNKSRYDSRFEMGCECVRRSQAWCQDAGGVLLASAAASWFGADSASCIRPQEILYKRRPWYLKKRTFLIAFVVLPAFAIFSLEYPASGAETLVQFAPAVHLATHRQYLAKHCGLLIRELVLGDGMTRLRAEVRLGSADVLLRRCPILTRRGLQEIAWYIKWAVERFDRVDKAIRLGGDMGNDVGADSYSKKQNSVMYEVSASGLLCAVSIRSRSSSVSVVSLSLSRARVLSVVWIWV